MIHKKTIMSTRVKPGRAASPRGSHRQIKVDQYRRYFFVVPFNELTARACTKRFLNANVDEAKKMSGSYHVEQRSPCIPLWESGVTVCKYVFQLQHVHTYQ